MSNNKKSLELLKKSKDLLKKYNEMVEEVNELSDALNEYIFNGDNLDREGKNNLFRELYANNGDFLSMLRVLSYAKDSKEQFAINDIIDDIMEKNGLFMFDIEDILYLFNIEEIVSNNMNKREQEKFKNIKAYIKSPKRDLH